MKHLTSLLLASLMALAFKPALAQNKHALIFAIGNYSRADGNGWPKISSTNDVKYIKAALNKQGFADESIKTVTDAQATVDGMNKALDNLISSVKQNDVVVIHISSHGEQVEDDNDDEPDGFDETIVAYDAVLPSKSTDFKKDQANYLRDDAFGAKINQLRSKLGKGGDVVVFMDLCHSGSGTRGDAAGKPRGNQPPLKSKGFQAKTKSDKEEVFKENKGTESGLATFVVFSAARAEELNYETFDDVTHTGMGSLTYAISKVFENLDKSATYRSVFAKVQNIIQSKIPGQHPVLEGDGIDRSLFGGRYVEQKPYLEISRIRDVKQLTVNGGLMAGLDSGAVVTLYPTGTADPAKAVAIAKGVVVSANYYTSTVKFDKDHGVKQPTAAWAFLTEPVYKANPVSISIQAPARGANARAAFSTTETNGIKTVLKGLPAVTFGGTPDLLIVKGTVSDSIIVASSGLLFQTISNIAANPDKLKKAVDNYVKYKYLQNLELKDPSAQIDIALVPVINGKPDTSMIRSKIVNGRYEFAEGDQFVIWAKNKSQQPLFLNIIDMQPDGVINPVLPNTSDEDTKKHIYPRDLLVQAETERLFKDYVIDVYKPFGTEVFKVFVSPQELDMERIIKKEKGVQSEGSRGNMKALEALVNDSDVNTRGTGSRKIGANDGSTYNLLFEIKAK